ncbi:hypothetical protein GCM10010129_45310 [Streptomyces fumigatiscleroticus]|nr:hypothetical protein GCM10010129_45310 [Streptomyces fumigatiscleroticus]
MYQYDLRHLRSTELLRRAEHERLVRAAVRARRAARRAAAPRGAGRDASRPKPTSPGRLPRLTL